MDQLKEFLRQAIKYRFWIAVGLSALLPMIAYFVGSSSIKAEAKTKQDQIEGANKGLNEYLSGKVPNAQYKPLVEGKTEVLTADVNAAWKKLYERQAPLLTWPPEPKEIQESFAEWGKAWPDPAKVDPTAVQLIINKYILAYPDYVTKVYKKVRPWDPQDGSGVVLTPAKDALLQPYPFDETAPPSDLGKIWGAQEKLWVQSALLEVIDKVNKSAKDWDSAVIKQINDMQVANPLALDQVAIANGDTLQPAKEMIQPGSAAETAATTAAAGAESAGQPAGYSQGGSSKAMAYGGGAGGGATNTPEVSYLSSSNDQYQVVPVSLAVLIDQNSINDLLVELANSPMSIQVIDYEQSRPAAKVTKPVKGEGLPGMGGYGGGFVQGGEGGYGPAGSGRRMSSSSGGYGGSSGYMQEGMGGGAGPSARASGKDLRGTDKRKEREEKQKNRPKTEVKIHDPYFNIVEVRIYGQARFYNLPPADQPSQSASADANAAAPNDAAADAEAKDQTPEAQQPAAAEKADAPKADAPKGDAPAATPKAETEAPEAKPEAPKETPEAKPEAPKAEPAKGDVAPKADAGTPAPKK